MFSRVLTMSKAHSIDISLLNTIVAIVMECNWITILVCNNSSIDMTVTQAMNRETSTRALMIMIAMAGPITHSSWI